MSLLTAKCRSCRRLHRPQENFLLLVSLLSNLAPVRQTVSCGVSKPGQSDVDFYKRGRNRAIEKTAVRDNGKDESGVFFAFFLLSGLSFDVLSHRGLVGAADPIESNRWCPGAGRFEPPLWAQWATLCPMIRGFCLSRTAIDAIPHGDPHGGRCQSSGKRMIAPARPPCRLASRKSKPGKVLPSSGLFHTASNNYPAVPAHP